MRRKHDGIFGTPVEPLFNENPHKLTPEMLEDCLVALAEENGSSMKRAGLNQNFFKHDMAAEFVFLSCEKLKIPAEARFLALEIFDNFMCRHIEDLYTHVQITNSKNKMKDWKVIQERVKNQIMLRVVSCCQLASKLTSHYKVVTPSSARRFLELVGQKYSMESILQSELRILKTLKYKLMVSSPLMYVETLLEILGHNESSLEVKMYHGVCLKIMDLYYIQRKQVYSKLFLVATGCNFEDANKDIKDQYSVVECDHLLLSSSVISAASHVVDQVNTNTVIQQLANISKIPSDDIVDFATVLVQLILEDNEQ